MKNEINMVLSDGTQLLFTMQNRIVVKNRFLNYDLEHGESFFCYLDEDFIEKAFYDFITNKLKKITVVGTTDPDLTFVLMPRGVEKEREMGDSLNIDKDASVMKIELDLCVDGAYGGSFWSYCLNEDETVEFISQWLGLKE